MALITTGGHPSTAPRSEAAAGASRDLIKAGSSGLSSQTLVREVSRPEFYRLPAVGGDQYFGFTRSFYYEGENRGYWRLARIRERGKLRGVTLVPYDAVSAFVRKQMDAPVEEAA